MLHALQIQYLCFERLDSGTTAVQLLWELFGSSVISQSSGQRTIDNSLNRLTVCKCTWSALLNFLAMKQEVEKGTSHVAAGQS